MEPVEPRMVSRFKISLKFHGSRWNPCDESLLIQVHGTNQTEPKTLPAEASKTLVNNLSVPQHRSGEQQRVDAVQDAAVAGDQGPGVLNAG